MEGKSYPPWSCLDKYHECEHSSVINRSLSGTYIRSVKRKYDEFEEDDEFRIPGFVVQQNARVEIGDECAVLREMVSSQQVTIQDLISELEEERNASSSATNEAMSMILRLQREKAEAQMEARQFKRYVEEKMAHDQQETLVLEDLLYKREQAIQSLTCEVQAYKHRMISYGLTEAEADGEKGGSPNNRLIENLEGQSEFPPFEIYPPLKCNSQDSMNDTDEAADVEKYAFGETPRAQDQLKDLDYRINQLERSPRTIQPVGESSGSKNVLEKVIVGQSPRWPKHLRKSSTDSSNSPFGTGKEIGPDTTGTPNGVGSFRKMEPSNFEENFNSKMDDGAEVDGMSDRVYTIDSVHQEASLNRTTSQKAYVAFVDDYMMTPRESPNDSHVKDIEIQKLYARLHALEADRESMRKSIITMGTDKAQLVLLKEIAQNLCKEMSPAKSMAVRKQSVVEKFSFMSVFKWVTSIVFWRRKSNNCRYTFGLSVNNAGLLMLLDQRHRGAHWRRVSRVQM